MKDLRPQTGVQTGYNPENQTLNGKFFLSSFVGGTVLNRTCENCACRKDGTCTAEGDGEIPKKFFGYKPDEKMPTNISGYELGNFCPYFIAPPYEH